jgi:hypothetical protein
MHSNVSVAVGGTVGNLSRWTVRGEDTTIARVADVGRRGLTGALLPRPCNAIDLRGIAPPGREIQCAPGATFNVAAMWPKNVGMLRAPLRLADADEPIQAVTAVENVDEHLLRARRPCPRELGRVPPPRALREHRGRLVRIHDGFGSGAWGVPRELSRENLRGSGPRSAMMSGRAPIGVPHGTARNLSPDPGAPGRSLATGRSAACFW